MHAAETSPGPLRLGRFEVDATPPLQSPVAYAPARSITDPLSARGVVLIGAGQPIVLCAVDWIGIGGSGQAAWKARLATAAGTTPDRVSVHTLHQHDAPRCDFRAEELLAGHGLGQTRFDSSFATGVIENVARAVKQATADARPVTHLGLGTSVVDRVASNRRILGPDGKVKLVRMSSTKNPEAIAAPEGTIDPVLKLVSFWNGEQPLAVVTYFACHPQSYYGKGDVTSEWVGLARNQRQQTLPGVLHVHFNGAGGNVAAGKYNDGTPERRPELAGRLADAMRRAWDGTTRSPLQASDIEWRTRSVALPLGAHIKAAPLEAALADSMKTPAERLNAATKLAWLERTSSGEPVQLACLRLKEAWILHMPGELFVEYQLAAQAMRPKSFVAMAAYGDYSPGYIGTAIAYTQGGYETEPRSSNVAPEVEQVLMDGMRELLK
ncbi:hypothetical protein [Caulifigura coniformis]|uniref:hypothetical protein n=1 Tax=Caulifigura coniformis TaxID=2527983 RepID=UPI001E4514FB|nr:hypothetical protein [Caulifigura coniformis]